MINRSYPIKLKKPLLSSLRRVDTSKRNLINQNARNLLKKRDTTDAKIIKGITQRSKSQIQKYLDSPTKKDQQPTSKKAEGTQPFWRNLSFWKGLTGACLLLFAASYFYSHYNSKLIQNQFQQEPDNLNLIQNQSEPESSILIQNQPQSDNLNFKLTKNQSQSDPYLDFNHKNPVLSFLSNYKGSLPASLQAEGELIASYLSDLPTLREMSEERLRQATQNNPDAFDLLNFYRTAPQQLPFAFHKVVEDYKIAEISKRCLYDATSSFKEDGAKLIDLDPALLDPDGQLSIDWNQLKKNFEIARFIENNPVFNCHSRSMSKDIGDFEDQILEAAQLTRPVSALNSFLDGPSGKVDDKLFQHILGDYWGRNTGLEGYSSRGMLQYFLNILKRQIQAIEQNPHCQEFEKTALCQTITGIHSKSLNVYRDILAQLEQAHELTTIYASRERESFFQAIERAMENLELGKSFFFSGGWANKSYASGHAVVFEIVKQTDGLFSFRIFNRGAGAEYHAPSLQDSQERAESFIEIQNISKNHLNRPFFFALQELNGLIAKEPEWNSPDLYNLLPLLRGEPKAPMIENQAEKLMVGHCTYLSLDAILRHQMKEAHSRFLLDLQMKTFLDYYEQNKDSLDKAKINLLMKGCYQLGGNIQKVFKEKKITQAELQIFQTRLSQIKEALELPLKISSNALNFNEFKNPEISIEKEIELTEFEASPSLDMKNHITINPLLSILTPESFASNCIQQHGQFAKGNELNQFSVVKQGIQDWIYHLPIQWIENPQILTKALTPEEARASLITLAEISKQLIWSHLKLIQQERDRFTFIEPQYTLAMMKLFTLGDAIAKSFKDSTGIELPALYQLDMDLLLNQASGHASLLNPELEDQLHAISVYWNQRDPIWERKKRDHRSFFELEKQHLGRRSLEFPVHSTTSSNPIFFNNHFMRWVKNYLLKDTINSSNSDPINLQALAAYYDRLTDATTKGLPDQYKNFIENHSRTGTASQSLPKAFFAMRDLSFSVHLSLHPFQNDLATPNIPYATKMGLIHDSRSDELRGEQRIYIFGGSCAFEESHGCDTNRNATYDNDMTDANFFFERNQDSLGQYAQIYGKQRLVSSEGTIGKSTDRRRIGPYLRAHLAYSSLETQISQEEMDELLALSSVPELQITETLGYFKKRLALFQDKAAQNLFFSLMSEPPLLINQLLRGKGSSFSKELAAFVKEGYTFYQQIDNQAVSSYFLDLNHYFESAVRYTAKKQGIEEFQEGFLSTRRERHEMACQEGIDPTEKLFHFLSLAALAEPAYLTVESASDCLTFYALSHLYPTNVNHPLYSKTKEIFMRSRLTQMQAPLEEIFKSNPTVRNQILNTVLKNVLGLTHPTYRWNKECPFPYFSTSDEAFTINVSNGRIYQQNQQSVLLPKNLRSDPLLKPFCSDCNTQIVKEVSPEHFEWMSPQNYRVRLFSSDNHELKMQREITPNIWAERTSSLPTLIPEGLLLNRCLWVGPSQESNLSKVSNWMGLSQGSNQKVWISDPASQNLLYEIDPNRQSIKELETGAELLLPPKGSFWDSLTGGKTLAWQVEGRITKLELPFHQLSFSVHNDRVSFEELPGFFLSKEQSHPLSNSLPQAILCENNNQQKKVVLLNSFYEKNKAFQDAKRAMFVYDVIDSTLRPQETVDQLYLSWLQMKNESYEIAYDLLTSKLKSQTRPMSQQEEAILEEIVRYQRFDPPILAIRMQALSMLSRNRLDFQGNSSEKLNPIIESLLWAYVQHLDQIPPRFRLSRTDEKWLYLRYPRYQLLGTEQRLSILTKERIPLKIFSSESIQIGGSFYLDEICKSTRNGTPNSSLLRKSSLEFERFYEVAKSPADVEKHREWYRDLFGSDPGLMSLDRMKEEISHALEVIAISRADSDQRTKALLLRAAQKWPDLAPQLDCAQFLSQEHRDPKWEPLVTKASHEINELFLWSPWPGVRIQSSETDPNPKPDELCRKEDFSPLSKNSLSIPGLREQIVPLKSTTGFKEVFQVDVADQAMNRQLAELSERVQAFVEEPVIHYDIPNRSEFDSFVDATRWKINALNSQLNQMESNILTLLQKEPTDQKQKILKKLKEISFHEIPLSIRDLSLAFLQADPSAIQNLNPALSCEESRTILQEFRNFLELSTLHQRQIRLHKAMQNAQQLPQGSQELSLALEEVKKIEAEERDYSIEEHPEYLLFEYSQKIMLRAAQIENLHKMATTGSPALEMIMGAGKTAVLTPLIAIAKAKDGKTLSTLIMPEALIPSVTEELKNTLGSTFGQGIELFHFDRNTPLNPIFLQRILDRLKTSIQEKKVAIISSASLQSFFLRYIEAIEKGEDKTEEILEFKKIFALLRSSGSLTIDEMDLIYDVLKSHHFTQGQPQPISTDLLEAVVHIYGLIVESPRLKAQWLFLAGKEGAPLTKESYRQLQSQFIQELLQPHEKMGSEIAQFIRALSQEKKQLLADYVLQTKNKAAVQWIQSIASQRVKNILAVWKEEVSRLLLLTSEKQMNEHYGPDPDQPDGMAIPYKGSKNPALGSQYGTDLETVNYTIQMHLAKGISTNIVRKEIERLQSRALEEIKAKNISVEKTTIFREFQKLTPYSHFNLFSLSEPQIEEIRKKINLDPRLKLHLIQLHILPELKTHYTQIHTNAQIFNLLFPKQSNGFSGTLWNFDSFPSIYQKIPSDTEERTIRLLFNKNTPVLTLNSQEALQAKIESIYAGNYRGSIADLAGIFRDEDSEAVAQEIIKLPIWSNTKIKGIAYYNQKDEKKIWLKKENKSIPFEQTTLTKEEMIAYWAQKYTTGSDIPLSLDMEAKVTVGKHTMLRDLLQAVWRLRKLHRGQRVIFVVSKEDAEMMREVFNTLKRPMMGDIPTLSELIFYTKYKEMLRSSDDNFRALRLKLKNVLIENFLQSMERKSVNELCSSKSLEELFFKKKSENAFDLYGQVEEISPSREVIQEEIKQLQRSKTFLACSPAVQRDIRRTWDTLIQKELPKLPEKASFISRFDTEVQVESQVESQVETHIQEEVAQNLQKEIQFELDRRAPKRAVFLWKEQGVFQKNYFIPASDIQSPNPEKFPGSLVVPDTEKVEGTIHPMDHLDLEGEDLLAKGGTRPLVVCGEYTDPALLKSWNMMDNQKTPLVLVIQDRKTAQLRMVRLNQWDALMFQRILQKDQHTAEKIDKRDHRLALYHLDLGSFAQGADPIPLKVFETEDFIRLKAQAKFMNGETNYSFLELEEIKKWAEREGASFLRTHFLDKILKNKEKSQAQYLGSSLEALFTRLIIPIQAK